MGALYIFAMDDKPLFAIDGEFYSDDKEVNQFIYDEIIKTIAHNCVELPKADNVLQDVCGVIEHDDNPFFYKLHYINEDDFYPVFFMLKHLTLDEYLDSINKGNFFKNEKKH